MKYLLLFLLVGCASEPKCRDQIRITKCGPDHKEKVICYETIRCGEKQ